MQIFQQQLSKEFFSPTMQISQIGIPNQYLFSPTMHVFDRRAKLLQRERAAANKEVEKFDFLKEEVVPSINYT